MIEPRSIQSQWFPMLAPLTARPQQHICMHDENQLLKSGIKLRYRFWRVCHKAGDVATPKPQTHNFMNRLIISPNFKLLALVVTEFLLNLLLKSDILDKCLVPPDSVKKFVSEISTDIQKNLAFYFKPFK